VVRTREHPTESAAAVRAAIWAIDRNVPVTEMRTMEDLLSSSLQRPRMILTLIALFAGIGVTLGAVGIYGVVAFAVRQRFRELGIRAALGAGREALASLVVRAALRAALLGLGFGLPAALGLAVVLRRFVFGVAPTDPISFGTVLALLAGVAFLASWLPARRAAAVDPAVVLREQ
jgi:ABC-type antimicrobial peptide transport system permease subunit